MPTRSLKEIWAVATISPMLVVSSWLLLSAPAKAQVQKDTNACMRTSNALYKRAEELHKKRRWEISREFARVAANLDDYCRDKEFKKATSMTTCVMWHAPHAPTPPPMAWATPEAWRNGDGRLPQIWAEVVNAGRVSAVPCPSYAQYESRSKAMRIRRRSSITMRSGIIRVRAMFCCFLGVRTSAATDLFNVASD